MICSDARTTDSPQCAAPRRSEPVHIREIVAGIWAALESGCEQVLESSRAQGHEARVPHFTRTATMVVDCRSELQL